MRIIRFVLGFLLITSAAHAATYLVGSDRDLIRASTAVVVATAGESRSVRSPGGFIETVTRMGAEEAIAGPIAAGEMFEVASPGGFVDGVGLMIAGAPRFANGERFLLCLVRNGDGEWTTRALALGKFTFHGDRLVREEEIFGWDATGAPHVERERAAEPFLRFARETARGGDPAADYFVERKANVSASNLVSNAVPSVSSYLIQQGGTGMRWGSFPSPQVLLSNGAQPGASGGGIPSAKLGIAAWTNDSGSNINYQYGGTTTSTGGLKSSDGINSIVFNDPTGYITGSFTGTGGDGNVLAVGGAWFGSSKHTFAGETFFTIQEADLVVQDGIKGAGLAGNGFDHVLAHELGHTLGFRHSDLNPDNGPCDSSTMSCTSAALMNSTVNFNNDPTGASLQAWDREAAAAVYGAGAPACTPPAITEQPHSATFAGSPVVLTVSATGTLPLSYQWYAGSKGDSSHPAGTGPSLTVSPSSTATYWVRVTGPCAPPADSDAATVTVNGCPAVFVTGISGTASIIEGKSTPLGISISAAGRPVTVQWYAGTRGDTSHPVSGGSSASITVTPPVTQTYWAQVTNDCGAIASSEAVTVTVSPCTAPTVRIQPVGGTVVAGSPAALSTMIAGTQPMQLQWFEGAAGDTSRPVTSATSASATTPPIFAKTSFWLRATNACGTVSTSAVTIEVVPTCTAPKLAQPPDQTIPAGMSTVITAAAAGPSLTFNWYQGPLLDFTHPVSGNGPSIITGAIAAPVQYWVNVTNPCGSARSATITISPAKRRRAAGR